MLAPQELIVLESEPPVSAGVHAAFLKKLDTEKRKELKALEKLIINGGQDYRTSLEALCGCHDVTAIRIWQLRHVLPHGTVDAYLKGPFYEVTGIHERTARRLFKKGRELEEILERTGLDVRTAKGIDIAKACLQIRREQLSFKKIEGRSKQVERPRASRREFRIPDQVHQTAHHVFGKPHRVISACPLDKAIPASSQFGVDAPDNSQLLEPSGGLLINGQEPLDLAEHVPNLIQRIDDNVVSPSLIIAPATSPLVWNRLFRRFPRIAFRGEFEVLTSKGEPRVLPHALIGIALMSADRSCELAEGFESVADVFSPVWRSELA